MKEVSKLDSIKLVYNEKTKRIVAKLITNVDGVKVRSRTIDNIEVIKVLLEALIKQSKMSISQLTDEKIIVVDSKLLDDGVIVLDSAREYHKYVFDKDMGSFNEVRLSRMERKNLGILTGDETSEVLSKGTVDGNLEEGNIPTEETTNETLEDTPVVEGAHEVNEDGSVDVENMSEDSALLEENTSGVRNMKINKRAIIALGLVPVICASSMFLNRDSKNNNSSNKHYVFNNQRPMPTDTVEMSPEPEIIVPSSTVESLNELDVYTPTYGSSEIGGVETYHNDYVASNTENIAYLTQEINNMCASLVPCNFYDFVDESERLSIKAINEYRNAAMSDRDRVVDLMNAYLKYILEGDIWFEDDVIRGYDYLTPLAKYVVLVSGQTLLPLCPYDYSYSNLNYSNIIDEFDNRINDIYSEIINKGRTI